MGGRGTQSELFRVTYVGEESTAPAKLANDEFRKERELRKSVELIHAGEQRLSSMRSLALQLDKTQDRFLRYAAHIAVQRPEAASVLKEAMSRGLRPDSSALADQIIAIARISTLPSVKAFDPSDARAYVTSDLPSAAEFKAWEVSPQLDLLRAISVAMVRLGEPTDAERTRLLELFEPAFPADDSRLNRELCQMLVYLKSPTVVAKTIDLMNAPPKRQDIDMGDLLTRNAGYGRAIKNMIANQPDKDQMWYAFCLRVAETGWTQKTRADYFRWFGRAQKWAGGNSFRKFLQNIENEAYAKTTENEGVMLEAVGARTPYKMPTLPKPVGPGKKWNLAEVRGLAGSKLNGRNFENGQKMFAATRCILCHRFAGDGGATGPDLTQLAGRFNVDALTEAIMQPSKVISDQYKASTVVTEDGKAISGRIVSENDKQISVLTDPEDSTKVVDIPKSDIDEIVPSTTSIMPQDLLNKLNEDEVLDLMAYLLSRGDKRHPMFRKKQ